MKDRVFVPAEGFDNGSLWRAVLERWLSLLEEYEKAESACPDLAYWYGERPLTGLLGVAAWMVKGWSLEEFGAERQSRFGKKRQGRGDLWIGRSCAKAIVEAKICWVNQKDVDKASDHVNMGLRKSRSQLRKLVLAGDDGQPVSVCYVVPHYSGPSGKASGEYALAELEEWARRRMMATAKHLATTKDIGESGSLYPGVLLMARHEKW